MTIADSIYSTGDSSPEKKNTTAPAEKKDTPEHHDGTTTGQASDDHSTIHAAKLDDVTKDTWFGWSSWKQLKDDVGSLVGLTPEKEKPYQTVEDIGTLNVSNFWNTPGTTEVAKVDTPAEKPVNDSGGISGWFSKMGDAVASVGKEVTGHVTSAMDWLFSTTDTTTGNKTEVSAKNGEAHIKGKNVDGTPVDATVGEHEVKGRVGAAEIALDKDTHAGTYESGAYKVSVEGSTKKVVDTATHQTFEWDEKAQKGFITDKDGKHLFDFNSREQLTQQLSPDKSITQTQTRADATADQVKAQMESGEAAQQTRFIVDKNGDYAVVRRDGLMVKTYKNGDHADPQHVPYVTIERDGHVLKIQDNHAYYQQEDPTTHEKSWVRMHGRHPMPEGMSVDQTTGAVKVDGQTVVTATGNVQADASTHIDTKTGKMTTTSDTGAVTVENSNGRTRVKHPGCGEIVNDGHTFINMDPKTQHTFSSMDSDTGQIRVFGGKNGSGITLDTKPGGNMTIKEADGQTTQMSNTGYFNSVDARGNTLMSMDTAGNVSFYDGTTVSADGTVANRYGSASAWDSGASGSGSAAIAHASTAVGAALAAIAQFDTTGSSLGALDAASSELGSLASLYTAMGRLDLVGQISNMQGTVDAARAQVLRIVQISADARRQTGDGSASRVHEALASGSPEAFLRKQQDEKAHPGDQSAVA